GVPSRARRPAGGAGGGRTPPLHGALRGAAERAVRGADRGRRDPGGVPAPVLTAAATLAAPSSPICCGGHGTCRSAATRPPRRHMNRLATLRLLLAWASLATVLALGGCGPHGLTASLPGSPPAGTVPGGDPARGARAMGSYGCGA